MAHALDGCRVSDLDGQSVVISDLWVDRTAVLVFVRHFGCLFCRQQIAEMLPVLERVSQNGAEVVVIGNGTVHEARAFQDEVKVPARLLTDRTRAAHDRLGMRAGLSTVLHPAVALRAWRAWRQGFRQSPVAGDPLQEGGVVVVAPGGIELYRHLSRFAGDHPDPAAILAALEAARA